MSIFENSVMIKSKRSPGNLILIVLMFVAIVVFAVLAVLLFEPLIFFASVGAAAGAAPQAPSSSVRASRIGRHFLSIVRFPLISGW